MSLTVVIVDDEAPARRKLARFVAELTSWSVLAEADSVASAVPVLGQHRPDVLLLDIQLGDGVGFDVLDQLNAATLPKVVFITAFNEHAVQAFEVHAIDYLLKPVQRHRFEAMVARVEQSSSPALNPELLRVLRDRPAERLYVEVNERGRFLPMATILTIESAGNYVDIRHSGGTVRQRGTLKDWANRLDADLFVQANRSAWVNLDAIVEVQRWFDGDRLLKLRDGHEVKLKRAFLDRSPLLKDL